MSLIQQDTAPCGRRSLTYIWVLSPPCTRVIGQAGREACLEGAGGREDGHRRQQRAFARRTVARFAPDCRQERIAITRERSPSSEAPPQRFLFGGAGLFAFFVVLGHSGFVQREGRTACALLRIGRIAPSVARALLPIAATCLLMLVLLLLLLKLLRLRLLRRQDAEIVLGVLQIILCHHPVAGRVRVARELEIFLVHMRSRAANLHLGPVRVERPVRIVAAAATTTAATSVTAMAAMTVLRPAAASA